MVLWIFLSVAFVFFLSALTFRESRDRTKMGQKNFENWTGKRCFFGHSENIMNHREIEIPRLNERKMLNHKYENTIST